MPHDVHAKPQANFRLDPALLARLKDGAKRHGQTQADIVARGTAAELDRLDGIAITDAGYTPVPAEPVFLAAGDEQPQQAGKNCKHRGMKLGKGVCPDCKEWVTK